MEKKLKQGEAVVHYEHKMALPITHWKDKGDVFMITTCIPDCKAVVQKRVVETTLPTVIHIYNNMMGSVDRSDQMIISYPTEHKQIKKWYKKHFMHLINISSFNTHIITNRPRGFHVETTWKRSFPRRFNVESTWCVCKKGGKLDALNFRTKLVEQIVEKYGMKVKPSVERRGGRPSLEGNTFRLTESYFLILIPPTDKKDKPTRHGTVCYKHEQRKEIRYLGRQCNEQSLVLNNITP